VRDLVVISPDLQINFYQRLTAVRSDCLDEALRSAVAKCSLTQINEELSELVDDKSLRRVASYGLRGEVLFSVPVLLKVQPSLLGYYRLLLGSSQKEFYNSAKFGRFKSLENGGRAPGNDELKWLCRSLNASLVLLLSGLPEVNASLVHELQLLTLGPQWRGGNNNRLGQTATVQVFTLVKKHLKRYIQKATSVSLQLENDSGRIIQFLLASDPDVSVVETFAGKTRLLISIEIKGGSDVSNVHNRLGEAEKSHLKAKSLGHTQFWTITKVPIHEGSAKKASPTTTRLFHLDAICNPRAPDYEDFRNLICSIIGIRVK